MSDQQQTIVRRLTWVNQDYQKPEPWRYVLLCWRLGDDHPDSGALAVPALGGYWTGSKWEWLRDTYQIAPYPVVWWAYWPSAPSDEYVPNHEENDE